MPYLIPERDDFDVLRADMSLGMRRAARYYNELVVPGIGGAWRVRHLSWPVAGIYLKQQMQSKHSAIAITHGIEALGNKLEWFCAETSDRADLHLRGVRAFARNENAWAFRELSQKRFYVQITHRQQCTRALPVDTGLGFTQDSSRFNSMVISTLGKELASALLDREGVGQGLPKLETNLRRWIAGEFDPKTNLIKLKPLLSPLSPTKQECSLVLGRLHSLVPALGEVGLRNDPRRRERLLRFLEGKVRDNNDWSDTESLLSWLETTPEGRTHAKDILTAIAFEDMRLAGVNLLGSIAKILGSALARLSLKDCVKNPSIITNIAAHRKAAKRYLHCAKGGNNSRRDADAFAQEALKEDNTEVICTLLKRDGRILSLAGDAIYPGPVYRPDLRGSDMEQDPDQETSFEGRPGRLFQFIALWRDCHGQT